MNTYVKTATAIEESARELAHFFIENDLVDHPGRRIVLTPNMVELVKRLNLALAAYDTEQIKSRR